MNLSFCLSLEFKAVIKAYHMKAILSTILLNLFELESNHSLNKLLE